MNVRNCRRCGRMFNHIGGEPVCPNCREQEEAKFQEVKKYVQDHKQATMNEIIDNCGVDAKRIKQWIREERLFFTDDSPVKINCESCGAQIATGRFCEKCKRDTANNFSHATRREEPVKPAAPAKNDSGNPRMHTYRNS